MSKSNDVTIFYFGGSGGFFALYMLLLTRQYQCCFGNGVTDVFKVKDTHWNIGDVSKWKESEMWPSNFQTLDSTFSSNRIFFVCNPVPLFLPKAGSVVYPYERFPGKKVLLYTDLETQWYLAKTKRAYWFQDGKELNGSGPQWKNKSFMEEQLRFRYSNVKQDSWPDCNSFDDFYQLPLAIQNQCINEHSFWEVLDYEQFNNDDYKPRGAAFNNEIVYKKAVDFVPQVDIVVKLQDIIKTKGLALFEQLGVETNSDISKFLVQYLSLHTAKQRNMLFGKSN